MVTKQDVGYDPNKASVLFFFLEIPVQMTSTKFQFNLNYNGHITRKFQKDPEKKLFLQGHQLIIPSIFWFNQLKIYCSTSF